MTYHRPARAAARSLAFSSSSAPPSATNRAPSPRLLAAIGLVALVSAGCANAPAKTGGGGDQNAPAGATARPAEPQDLRKKLPAYAKCMRENGVGDFPDPGADGVIQYFGDSHRQEFKSAGEKCDDLLPEDRGQNR